MACTDSLKPFFDWIKQTTGTKPGKIKFPLWATLTIHRSDEVSAKRHVDTVEYAEGEVFFKSEGGKEFGSGVIPGQMNTMKDGVLFPGSKQLTFEIKVFADGAVSVLKLLNGKRFLGRGPEEFKGTCTKGGLITGVVGESLYGLGLSKGVADAVDPV